MRSARIPRSLIQQGGWHHQEGHCPRSGRSGPWHRLGAARNGPTAQPGSTERARRICSGCHDTPGPDTGCLVHVCDGDQPGRTRNLRLPAPRSQDLSAGFRLESLRAEECLPAAQGCQSTARNTGLGSSQVGGHQLDDPSVSLHVPAGLDARANALGNGRPGPERRAGNGHVLHDERSGPAARERERRPDSSLERTGSFPPT